MGLRWHIPLPGPFSISGNVFPRNKRTTYWRHPGCYIKHRTKHAADTCPNRARLARKGR